jgi:hypothetical protein
MTGVNPWSSTSASSDLFEVARKLATRWWGNFRMKPTVSETRALIPLEIHLTREGIERREEPVLHEDLVLPVSIRRMLDLPALV